jgi:hypothetical protein
MGLKASLNSMFTRIGVLCATFGIRVSKIWAAFDIRPVFFFGGLSMLGYGLFLYLPWVSLSVCGVIFMAVGYLMRGDNKP